MDKENLAIYIHVPFCVSKCKYCDFNSYSKMDYLADDYFDAIIKELKLYIPLISGYNISSVFIGGGTPSLISPSYYYKILNILKRELTFDRKAEITIEANPGTLNFEKLIGYKTLGINRLSIGLQAWQDTLLNTLGRIHTVHQFIDSLEEATKAGFKNINIDLMFGIPGQNIGDWFSSVVKTAGSGVSHVSCYSLKYEEGTYFNEMLNNKELEPIDDELDRRMYHGAVEKLERFGYKHYELSNFAMPGFECRHNLTYWSGKPYIGLGAGAHSYFDSTRYCNVSDPKLYIRRMSEAFDVESIKIEKTFIDKNEEMKEFMLLGLRLIDGVHSDEFLKRFGVEIDCVFFREIEYSRKRDLLEPTLTGYRLTKLGEDLANEVFMQFV